MIVYRDKLITVDASGNSVYIKHSRIKGLVVEVHAYANLIDAVIPRPRAHVIELSHDENESSLTARVKK